MEVSINKKRLKKLIETEVEQISKYCHEAESLLGEGTNSLGEHFQICLVVTTVEENFIDIEPDSYEFPVTVEACNA